MTVHSTIDYDERTDKLTFTTTQDRMPVLEEAHASRMENACGYGEGALGRKVASIDMVTIHNARNEGYDLFKPADLYAYLKKHPEYMAAKGRVTSKGIDSGRDGKIIVK